MAYSLSKTPISLETAQSIVAAHFGAQARIANYAELTDGMYNAAYLIELANGQRPGLKTVLKVAPPDHIRVLRYETNIMQAEVDVLRLVRAKTDVPVPEVFAYDASRLLLDNDYCLMAFVPGEAWHKLRRSFSPDDQIAIDRRTGEYLRQMNAIGGETFGYFAQPQFRYPTWRQAFDCMFVHILQDGRDAGVELPLPYDVIYARASAHYACLDEVAAPALVHWDLWDGNIFVDAESKAITGILDCERALWGDPLMEVNFGAFGVNPAVMQGYGQDMLATPAAQTRRILYNLYLWLIMVIECTYRQYKTHDQENWAREQLLQETAKLVSQPIS
jgi:aminoglycoside phosphotransferase (APT) family kinase protein